MSPSNTSISTLLHPQRSHPQSEREYAEQSERLGQYTAAQEDDETGSTRAVCAEFVTHQDPVIRTANDGRLPAVPLDEAIKLNSLREAANGGSAEDSLPEIRTVRESKDGTVHGPGPKYRKGGRKVSAASSDMDNSSLAGALPPSRTNPLFPPLPLYGPPSKLRSLQCTFFQITSFFLSLAFLLIIILGATFTNIPTMMRYIVLRTTFQDPYKRRPFRAEEKERQKERDRQDREWLQQRRRKPAKRSRSADGMLLEKVTSSNSNGRQTPASEEHSIPRELKPAYLPTEGGPDPLVCDIGYYARREGLDVEHFKVQTEDGFIIDLQHVYNPQTETPAPAAERQPHSPTIFQGERQTLPTGGSPRRTPTRTPPSKYPVLLLHGLLQSSGAYCCNGPSSLAFYLAKAGYDVWLGNNRCGFEPQHTMLEYSDPRMWAWNIRQMGVMDLSALTVRVLSQTGSEKLALVAHSQGTTQTLVALAKEQRPELGQKISVFCALAPAAYAGPLIGKAYFKFMRILTPSMFKCVFGIHSFIPLMMKAHALLPGRFYGDMGYLVFSFLFNWSDDRWDRGLRRRFFQFSPTYVSAESMRWWLGRDCFAKQRCILSTREEGSIEDKEDEEEDELIRQYYENGRHTSMDLEREREENMEDLQRALLSDVDQDERGRYAWFDESFPPLALWVAGADDLVDGRRLLRRFDRGREPHVRVVHKKIIEGYEHLDVIWAMDSIEKVGSEVKDVIWRTMPAEARKSCTPPEGCKDLEPFDLDTASVRGESARDVILDSIGGIDQQSSHGPDGLGVVTGVETGGPVSPTLVDASTGGS